MPTLYSMMNETGNRNRILETCKFRFQSVHWIDPSSIEHNYACIQMQPLSVWDIENRRGESCTSSYRTVIFNWRSNDCIYNVHLDRVWSSLLQFRMDTRPRFSVDGCIKAKFHYAIWIEPASNQLRTGSES